LRLRTPVSASEEKGTGGSAKVLDYNATQGLASAADANYTVEVLRKSTGM